MSNSRQHINIPVQRRPVPSAQNPATSGPGRPQQQHHQPAPPPARDRVPALPPRPAGGSARLTAQSNLIFPPPPRSPNRPPELPPRPQQHSQPYPQTYVPTTSPYNPAHPAQHRAQNEAQQANSRQIFMANLQPAHQQGQFPPPPLRSSPPAMQALQQNPPTFDMPPVTPPVHQKQPIAESERSPQQAYSYCPDPRTSSCTFQQDHVQDSHKTQMAPPAVFQTPPPPSPAQHETLFSVPGQASYLSPTPPRINKTEPGTFSVYPTDTVPTETTSMYGPAIDPIDSMSNMVQSLNLSAATSPTSCENSKSQSQEGVPNPTPTHLAVSDPVLAELSVEAVHPSVVADATQQTQAQIDTYPADPRPATECDPAPAGEPSATQQILGTYSSYELHTQSQAPLRETPPHETLAVPHSASTLFVEPDERARVSRLPNKEDEKNSETIQYAASSKPHTYALVPTAHAEQPRCVDSPFRAATTCIDTDVKFATWWYTHASAPDYFICSRCYMDYLYPTRFRDDFSGHYLRDGAVRRCRFKVPRLTEQLLADASDRGSLDRMLQYMNLRIKIPDCKRKDGAKGLEGIKWFTPKENALPGFVSCEACFQDIICISPFAYSFEQATGHEPNQIWTCDMAVPFVRKEFELRTKTADWATFLKEAKARLGMPACPKLSPIMVRQRKWFVPVNDKGPPDAVLCSGCYCDYILKSGQESFWQEEKFDLFKMTKTTNTCMMGQFNLMMAMQIAEKDQEWDMYWHALNRIAWQEKGCVGTGIVDGNWYTLSSQPEGFNVCGACHAGIIEMLHLEQFFVPCIKPPAASGVPVLCSLNVKSQRFVAYVEKLVQTWITFDSTSWNDFALQYGNIAKCPRMEDFKNRSWYGWKECVICAECYVEFVQGTALDTPEFMQLRPEIIESPHICEMYSPRMRALYQEACAQSPPNTAALFAFVEQRRIVYWQTIPICRNMLIEQKLLANQIGMTRMQGVVYTGMGNLEAVSMNHGPHRTYGQAGVGYGYDNMHQLEGARYNAQANQMQAGIGGSKIVIVGQLEEWWRTVE